MKVTSDILIIVLYLYGSLISVDSDYCINSLMTVVVSYNIIISNMISDFRKSINSILYERVSSPLFGTFVISWLIWNWKITYLTLFVSESNLDKNKLEYIL